MIWIVVLALCGFASAVDNGMYDPNIFQGDILLTPDQKAAIEAGRDPSLENQGRASVKKKLWPNAVLPYTIDANLGRNSRGMQAIRAGMKLWTDTTCVTFKPRTNERNYAHFYIGGGCSSYVGPIGGRQMISLAPGCWVPSIVSHEIGHCLGFFHEQSRPDRDNYVTIVWNNINSEMKFNFNKMTVSQIDSLGTPYDYNSVMHYDRRAFSMNGRDTIIPKKAGASLGNRRGPTPIDIKQMNLLYKCGGGGGGTVGPVTEAPVTQAPVTQAPVTQAPVTQAPDGCVDKDRRCRGWVSYCRTNDYMKANCKKTCNLCGGGGGSCVDRDRRCPYWPRHCRSNSYVQQNCKKTCRFC